MGSLAGSPAVSKADSLVHYLDEVRRIPLLEPQEEYRLAKRWRKHGDRAAMHRLVTSHLRLVAKIAIGHRGYGLSLADLISEGSIGLIRAVERFKPERDLRLATYATWWIRAAIQDYIMRSWSLVKLGTTGNQKKLFFNLGRAKRQVAAFDELRSEQAQHIARLLGVSDAEVVEMNNRLAGEMSLNAPLCRDAEAGDAWQDWLVDDGIDPEARLAETQELHLRRAALSRALSALTARERRVLEARRMVDEPTHLKILSAELGVSVERVRQIEVAAFEKVQTAVRRKPAMTERAGSRGTERRRDDFAESGADVVVAG